MSFESKISLDEVTKSINSQTNNKSLGNDGLTTEFYKYLSNKISLILLDVYDSWEKIGTMVLFLVQESYLSCINLGSSGIVRKKP